MTSADYAIIALLNAGLSLRDLRRAIDRATDGGSSALTARERKLLSRMRAARPQTAQ